jgi:polyribonucleotide nucleotidyltransferase
MQRIEKTFAGRRLVIETGRMAKQADGSIYATYGETSLLATAQSAPGRPDIDFFPLTVEYREKTYAAGKVPGGFFKREMRPRDHEDAALLRERFNLKDGRCSSDRAATGP